MLLTAGPHCVGQQGFGLKTLQLCSGSPHRISGLCHGGDLANSAAMQWGRPCKLCNCAVDHFIGSRGFALETL